MMLPGLLGREGAGTWVAPKTRVRASLLCYWRLCECMDLGGAGWALKSVHGRNNK